MIGSKKSLDLPLEVRRSWPSSHDQLSIVRQCGLAGLNRATWYYKPVGVSAQNLDLMRHIDELYMKYPFYGSRRMAVVLSHNGNPVNRKRVQRLMRLMGIEAIYTKPRTTLSEPEHEKYPYLLRDVEINRCDQVWSTDITYIRLRQGFMYLVAVMDWYSRLVLSWELSNSIDSSFCVSALEQALRRGKPAIFNTDQGSQFTSADFTKVLKDANVKISMDGRGRWVDNVFIERLWRTVKYEEVYLKDYDDVPEAIRSLGAFFRFYNTERPHQSLNYDTPLEVYLEQTGHQEVAKYFLI